MSDLAGRRAGRLGNLPGEVAGFVGRGGELREVKRLLSASRLVTLAGIGGVGKTRLASRVAAEVRRAFPDGTWFVDLTELPDQQLLTREMQDPEVLAHLLAGALGLPAQSSRSPLEHLREQLASRGLLLLLDNCEHLLPACAVLAEALLRAGSEIRILATSREPLRIPGEVIFAVPPMAMPDPGPPPDPAALLRVESVALFVAKATAARPGFELTTHNQAAVAAICRRLDGLPLAIELAAARVTVLTPQEILDRLTDRFAVLGRGHRTAPDRQRTMRGCLDWSFELCAKPEQRLWTRMAVFAGGAELDAVEGICADHLLPAEDILEAVAGLVDKSILTRTDDGDAARYRMLEAVRDFGLDRLGRDADAATRRRHRDWYLRLVTRAEDEWISERQAYWVARLGREHANIRVAVQECLAEAGAAEDALLFAVSLPPLHWIAMGRFHEGRQWLDRALASATAATPVRARALLLAGQLAIGQGDAETGLRLLDEGEELAGRLPARAELAYAAYLRGLAAMFGTGDLPAAIALFERAVADLPSSPSQLRLDLLLTLGTAAGLVGDRRRAEACEAEVLRATQPWDSGFYRARAIWGRALAAWHDGDVETAAALVSERLRRQRTQGLDDRYGIALSLEVLAWIAATAGRPQRAATLLGAAESGWTELGSSAGAYRHLERHHRDTVRRVRETLGESAYHAAVADGRRLPPAPAVAFALGDQAEPVPPAAGPSPLSRREAQVADLIAAGLSNKEIAARLVISQRTAESHVEHILTKLGFSTRTQIAAWIAAGHEPPGP